MDKAADASIQKWLKLINGLAPNRNDRAQKYQLKKYSFMVTGNKSYYPIPDSLLMTNITFDIPTSTPSKFYQAIAFYPTLAGFILDSEQGPNAKTVPVKSSPPPQKVKPKAISAVQHWQVEKQEFLELQHQHLAEIATLKSQWEDSQILLKKSHRLITEERSRWQEQQQEVQDLKQQLEKYGQQEQALKLTNEQLNAINDQHQALTHALKTKQSELDDLSRINKEQNLALKANQESFKNHQVEHQQLQEQLAENDKTLQELHDRHQSAKTQLSSYQTNESKLIQENEHIQNRHSQLKQDYQVLENKLKQSENRAKKSHQQFILSQTEAETQKQLFLQRQSELEKAYKQELVESEQASKQRLSELQQAYKIANDQLIQSQTTVTEQTLMLLQQQQAMEHIEKSWRQMQDDFAHQEQQYHTVFATYQDVQQRLEIAAREQEELQMTISDLTQQLANVQAAQNEVQTEIDGWRQKYEQLNDKYAKKELELAKLISENQRLSIFIDENQEQHKSITSQIQTLTHTCHQLQTYIQKQKDKIQFRNTQLLQARDTIQRLKQALLKRR